MKSLDQLRAAHAYAAIAGAAEGDDLDRARRLPAMLQQNGLLATWAYYLGKKAHEQRLLPVLLDHLRGIAGLPAIDLNVTPEKAFLAWVGSAERPGLVGHQLRDLTAEAVAFSGWLKRAAEARTSKVASPKTAGQPGGGADG